MSGRQFTEWQLYELVEPFGERAQYWRAGQICAAVTNSQRTKRSDPIAIAEDFMPRTFRLDQDDDEAAQGSGPDEYDQLKAVYDRAKLGTA
jgi:hypothetical protein